MDVQYWQVSGYEANAEIEDQPAEPGGVLHRGVSTHDGATVWVFWDELLHRWQEVDPGLDPAAYPTDDVAAEAQAAPDGARLTPP